MATPAEDAALECVLVWFARSARVWALDFQFDETADGRRLKLLNIVDEHTREALAMRVTRHCTADDVVTELTGLVATRGAPEHLRMDNGPEMIACPLRDYCRLAAVRTEFIEPGSPWQNPFIESFNGRVRDELLNVEEFPSLTVNRPGNAGAIHTAFAFCSDENLIPGMTPHPHGSESLRDPGRFRPPLPGCVDGLHRDRPPCPQCGLLDSDNGWTTRRESRQPNAIAFILVRDG